MGVQVQSSTMKVTVLIVCCAAFVQSSFVSKKSLAKSSNAAKAETSKTSSVSTQSSSSCTSIPKEVCENVRTPSVQYKTERQCTSLPVSRQECTTKRSRSATTYPRASATTCLAHTQTPSRWNNVKIRRNVSARMFSRSSVGMSRTESAPLSSSKSAIPCTTPSKSAQPLSRMTATICQRWSATT